MDAHGSPRPLEARFWTPGTQLLFAFMLLGLLFIIARLVGGLGAVTNLDNYYPWGLWIGFDVATGVALAAGGFTTAALVQILGRRRYEGVTRPALLTAMLGYTFVAVGLFFDIGRYWAVWHPIFYWQPNSVLFEVAMCVMVYTTVLHLEFLPVISERVGKVLPILHKIGHFLEKIMPALIILGVVLSCMHQSGLGSLLLIAPTKVHPLWYTPILPLLFLTSAIAVGYPMVVFETTLATGSFGLEDEMEILRPLTRITIALLGIYLALKIGDLVVRKAYVYLLEGSAQSHSFLVELLGGVALPWIMLLMPGVRRSRKWLFVACTLIVLGVALNRMNVFIVGFQPAYSVRPYYPHVGEIAITLGLTSSIIFFYRLCVTYLPVLSARKEEGHA